MSIRDLFKKFKADAQTNSQGACSNSFTDVLNREASNSKSNDMKIEKAEVSIPPVSSKRKLNGNENFWSSSNENTISFQTLPTEWKPQLKKAKKTSSKDPKEKIQKSNSKDLANEKKSPGPLAMKSVSRETIEELLEENQTENLEQVDTNLKNFKMPMFLRPENILDKNMKKPIDEGYDPSTIHIPYEEWSSLTGFMRQYWEIKSKHFDKLVAHSMFDMYWFYYNDALVTSKLLDLKLGVHDDKIQSYIHCKSLEKCLPKLFNSGYRVVIVEKIEGTYSDPIPNKKKKKDEVLNREISQIISKGTFIGYDESYQKNFSLCLVERESIFGIILFETTMHEFYIEEYKDDEKKSKTKNLLTKFKPSEIIFYNELISEEMLGFIKLLSYKPLLSPFSLKTNLSSNEIIKKMKKMMEETPKVLEKLHLSALSKEITNTDEGYRLMTALGLCFIFLESMMLDKIILPKSKWFLYSSYLDSKASLYMDSQTLSSLEIIDELYGKNQQKNSLIGIIDHTSSPFGKRLLHKWIQSPLIDQDSIQIRQKAIDDLITNPKATEIIQNTIGRLGDLERNIHKIYNWIDSKKLRALKADDVVARKLGEFHELLNQMKNIEIGVKFFQEYFDSFSSVRLKSLSSFKMESTNPNISYSLSVIYNTFGLLPRIAPILDEIQSKYKYEDLKYYPSSGASKESDFLISQLENVKVELNNILDQARKELNSRDVNFCHSKQPYELEVPENLVDLVDREIYVLCSKRKGYLRFYSPEIENNVRKLKTLEENLQKFMRSYVVELFNLFFEHRESWDQLISCLAELDCLASLSIYARKLSKKCKPRVFPMCSDTYFELRDMKHPLLFNIDDKTVGNDIIAEDQTFVLTGPNMGGKSTLLRMACLAVILAQIGSYIPASSFKFTIIDRIFTRIGASDRLLEGRSTFFVELEEAYHMVTEASRNSLLVIDELGRGTSTYDGVALAYSTLRFITERIQCLTLFATHYHSLISMFEENKNISFYFMGYEIDQEGQLVFKYKFTKGVDKNSHGLKIAQMASIEKNVIEIAKEKSDIFDLVSNIFCLKRKIIDNLVIEQLNESQIADSDLDYYQSEIKELVHNF